MSVDEEFLVGGEGAGGGEDVGELARFGAVGVGGRVEIVEYGVF